MIFMGNPLKKRGGQGDAPQDCFPFMGKEGVTLIIAVNEQANNGKNRPTAPYFYFPCPGTAL
jgi:hypothetical protein